MAILPLLKEATDLTLTPKYQSAVLQATGETAAFGLAQFLLDYSDFIAEDQSHVMITN